MFAGQGVCLFGLNFALYYTASHTLPSGVLAICFATSTFWAALFSRLFYGAPLRARQLVGAAIGVGGLALLTRGDLVVAGGGVGLALALVGAMLFALGNMLAVQLQLRGVPQREGVAWGMSYGAVGLAVAALAQGQSLAPPLERAYWIAVVFLAVVASVIAFTVYLTLVTRLGAARAAYATVLFPIVALLVSAQFEGFQPTAATLAGVAAVLAGAALTLRRTPAIASTRQPPL